MDRYKAVQWLQEHLLPESALALLLARPTHEKPATSDESTLSLEHITISEFFALSGAIAHYDTELRLHDRRDPRLDALEALHQRLLTVTVQPPLGKEE